MITNVVGQSIGALTAAGDRFAGLEVASVTWGSAVTTTDCRTKMAVGGTLLGLIIVADNGPGAGLTRSFTIYINGVDTGITCSMTGAGGGLGVNITSDTTHQATFSAGDLISIRSNCASLSTSLGTIRWCIKADCGVRKSFIGSTSAGSLTATTGVNTYLPVQGSNKSATATLVESVMPTAGTFKNAYADLSGTPTAGTSYTFTLFKNGVATALTFQISGTNTFGSDTNAAHAVSYAAGDRLYWEVVPAGTPTARNASLGVEFDPTTDGESLLMFANDANFVITGAQRYQNPITGGATNSTTEGVRYVLTNACTLKNMYVYMQTSPGSGNYKFQYSIGGAFGNLVVNVTAATSGNDTTHTDVVSADGTTLTMGTIATGPPTGGSGAVSCVSYIAPITSTPTFLAATASYFTPTVKDIVAPAVLSASASYFTPTITTGTPPSPTPIGNYQTALISGSTLTFSMPAGSQVGDLALLSILANSSTVNWTVTFDLAEWNAAQSSVSTVGVTGLGLHLFAKILTAADISAGAVVSTLSVSGLERLGNISIFRNAVAKFPWWDGYGEDQLTAADTSIIAPGITNSFANDLVIGFAANDKASSQYANPTGFATEAYVDSTNLSMTISRKIFISSGATGTSTFTGGVSSSKRLTQIIALKFGVNTFPAVLNATATYPTPTVVNKVSPPLLAAKATYGGTPYYMQLTGISGYASTPDTAANSMSGDTDFIIRASLDDWTVVGDFIGKWGTTAAKQSYVIRTTGGLKHITTVFVVGASNTVIQPTSDASLPVTNGVPIWMRVTRNATTGDVTFYYAYDQETVPTVWTQLGSVITDLTGSFRNGTNDLFIGSEEASTGFQVIGKIYRALIKSSIGGTTVVDFNPADAPTLTNPTFVSATGETWTLNGTGQSLVGQTNPTVKSIATPSVLSATASYGSTTVTATGLTTPSVLSVTATYPAFTAKAIVAPAVLSVTATYPGTTEITKNIPSVLSVTATYPAPVVISTAFPGVLSATATYGSSTITATGLTTPTFLSVTATYPSPTVKSTVIPIFLAATATYPSPSIVISVSTTVTPSVLSVTASYAAPTLIDIAKPSVLSATSTYGGPVITASGLTVPSFLSVTATYPSATIIDVTKPTVLSATATYASPTISTSTSSAATPSFLSVTATYPTPTIIETSTIGFLAIPASYPSAVIQSIVAPGVLSVVATYPGSTEVEKPTPGVLNATATYPALIVKSIATPSTLQATATYPGSIESISNTVTPAVLNVAVTYPSLSFLVVAVPSVLNVVVTYPGATEIEKSTPGILNATVTYPALVVKSIATPGILACAASYPSISGINKVLPSALSATATYPSPTIKEIALPGVLNCAANYSSGTVIGKISTTILNVTVTYPTPSFSIKEISGVLNVTVIYPQFNGLVVAKPTALGASASYPTASFNPYAVPAVLNSTVVYPAPILEGRVSPIALQCTTVFPAIGIRDVVNPDALLGIAIYPLVSIYFRNYDTLGIRAHAKSSNIDTRANGEVDGWSSQESSIETRANSVSRKWKGKASLTNWKSGETNG